MTLIFIAALMVPMAQSMRSVTEEDGSASLGAKHEKTSVMCEGMAQEIGTQSADWSRVNADVVEPLYNGKEALSHRIEAASVPDGIYRNTSGIMPRRVLQELQLEFANTSPIGVLVSAKQTASISMASSTTASLSSWLALITSTVLYESKVFVVEALIVIAAATLLGRYAQPPERVNGIEVAGGTEM